MHACDTSSGNGRWTARPRLLAIAIALLATAAILPLAALPAGAATSAVTVTMAVPSALTFGNGCTQNAAWNLGTVLPGSPATTATAAGSVCSFSFSSSNDTAMLRMYQADGAGSAMSTGPGPMVRNAFSNSLFDIRFATATTGFAVGETGELLRTTDSGATWPSIASGTVSNINDLYVTDANTVTFVADGGLIRQTTNASAGAPTWTTRASGTASGLLSIAVASPTRWYAVGYNGTILTSADAGLTWTVRASGAGVAVLRDVAALPGTDTAWAVGDSNVIRKTTDGGVTWSGGAWPLGVSGEAESVYVFDATHLWVAGDDGALAFSGDGGATWTTRTFVGETGARGQQFWGIVATSATNAIAVGVRGEAVRTTDSGSTWTSIGTSQAGMHEAITVQGANLYAAGRGGEIVRSADNGLTWTLLRQDFAPLFGVDRAPGAPLRMWAVGGNGTIRTSADGGATWTTQVSGTNATLDAVSAVSATTAWVSGAGGTLLTTSDGGATWTPVTSGTGAELYGIQAIDATRIIAVGTAGTVIRSVNGGTTFSSATWGAQDLQAVDFRDASNIYVVGRGATILTSGDGGATFTGRAAGTAENLFAVAADRDTPTAWVSGRHSGSARRTTDGGVTWSGLGGSTGASTFAIGSVAPAVAFFGGNGNFASTADGGLTVSSLTGAAPKGKTWAISARDANVATLVGEDGDITTTGTGTSMSDYAAGANWGSGGVTNMFGVCIQALGGSATVAAPFVVDATPAGTPTCTTSDSDPWAAVPVAATKFAATALAGQSGTADLVWGVRAAGTQAPGTYRATVVIEALAPAV